MAKLRGQTRQSIGFVLVLLMMVGLMPAVGAQESGCNPLAISIQLTDALNQAQRDMAQSKDLAVVFDQLESVIQGLRETCAGGTESTSEAPTPLSFSGDADTVIGPIHIPAGTYRAVATTAGYLIVHVSAISGECGAGTRYMTEGLFSLSRDEAVGGAEAILTSKECNALLEISNVTDPWILKLEKVG